MPCAGGRIYRARILETFIGLEEGTLTREPAVDTALVEEDARWGAAEKKGLWFSIPAPHLLGIRDGYFHDREEFCEGICTSYRQVMRAMRDSGAGGHVILGDEVHEGELEHLAGPRTFFFYPDIADEDLPAILEAQNTVAVPGTLLAAALDRTDEYDLRSLFILDGKQEDILTAAEYLDPDQFSLGGYCREDCREYLEETRGEGGHPPIDSATFTRSSKWRFFLNSTKVILSTKVKGNAPPEACGCPPPPNFRAMRWLIAGTERIEKRPFREMMTSISDLKVSLTFDAVSLGYP